MSTQPSPNPWATGPLHDLLRILAETLATYREQGAQAQADALLLAFAQEHLLKAKWAKQAGAWTSRAPEGPGVLWYREILNPRLFGRTAGMVGIGRDGKWYAEVGHLEGTFGPHPTRNEAMKACDALIAEGWLYDPALPPEEGASSVGEEGQREGTNYADTSFGGGQVMVPCSFCGGTGRRYGRGVVPEPCRACEETGQLPDGPEGITLGRQREEQARRREGTARQARTPARRHRWSVVRSEPRSGLLCICVECELYQFRAGSRRYLRARSVEEAWLLGGRREGSIRAGRCEPAQEG